MYFFASNSFFLLSYKQLFRSLNPQPLGWVKRHHPTCGKETKDQKSASQSLVSLIPFCCLIHLSSKSNQAHQPCAHQPDCAGNRHWVDGFNRIVKFCHAGVNPDILGRCDTKIRKIIPPRGSRTGTGFSKRNRIRPVRTIYGYRNRCVTRTKSVNDDVIAITIGKGLIKPKFNIAGLPASPAGVPGAVNRSGGRTKDYG